MGARVFHSLMAGWTSLAVWASAAIGFTSLLAAGCAPERVDEPVGTGSGSRPLLLEGTGPWPSDAETTATLYARDGAWILEGAEGALRSFADSAATASEGDRLPHAANLALSIEEGERFSIEVPLSPAGESVARAFQRVVLHLRSPREGAPRELSVRLEGHALPHRTAPSVAVHPARGLQTIAFDFAALRGTAQLPERLLVEVGGTRSPFALALVELQTVPRTSFLPAPTDTPDFIAVGRDLRLGHGLAPGNTLAALVPAGAETLLSFAHAIPPELAGETTNDGSPIELVLTVLQGAQRIEHGFRVSTAWRTEEISLPRADTARSVEFALRSAAGDDVAALADVRCAEAPDAGLGAGPTVLLVTSDTHRGDHLGRARDGAQVMTPTLDELASRGVLFELAFSSTNITNPSHGALFTGLHPRVTGIVDNQHALANDARTLAEHFSDAGYLTWASVSTRHLHPKVSGLGQGFTRFSVPDGIDHDAQDAAESIERWLPDAAGRPLFVWLHVFDAHHPYGPPVPFDRRYYETGRDPFDAGLPAPDIPKRVLPYDLVGLRDLEFPRAQYRAEIDYLDHVLARVLALPRFGQALTAVTGDHGESLGEHGIWFSHGGLYPQTLHVPLVLSWPGAPGGTRVSGAVGHLDLGRTLLELAELPSAEHFPGRSLLRYLDDGARPSEPIFGLSSYGTVASVTRDEWHLILHLRTHRRRDAIDAKRRFQVELYDLVADPDCELDLVFERPERARELCAQLVEWLRSPTSRSWRGSRSDDEELLRGLQALGYTTSDAAADEPEGDSPEAAPQWIDDDFDPATNPWLRERSEPPLRPGGKGR